jgi:hypothetical protein
MPSVLFLRIDDRQNALNVAENDLSQAIVHCATNRPR